MSSFSFNFSPDGDDINNDNNDESSNQITDVLEDLKGKLINITNDDLLNKTNEGYIANVEVHINNISFKLVQPSDTSIDGGKDIIPGSYEGGFKLWECSLDLVEYLLKNSNDYLSASALSFSSYHVLDLGCGHGIPGICAANILNIHETSSNNHYNHDNNLGGSISFLDLNEEVLRQVTWPNIVLNCSSYNNKYEFKCIAGDFRHLISNSTFKYDLILTAETLYTLKHCLWVVSILDLCLTSNGKAIIATKRYYFGCGGGTLEFMELISKKYFQSLQAEIKNTAEDGASNIRDVILVTRPS